MIMIAGHICDTGKEKNITLEASVNFDYFLLESERGPKGDRYQLTLAPINPVNPN